MQGRRLYIFKAFIECPLNLGSDYILLYVNVFHKFEFWQNINDAILLFFSVKLATSRAINACVSPKYSKLNFSFCAQLLLIFGPLNPVYFRVTYRNGVCTLVAENGNFVSGNRRFCCRKRQSRRFWQQSRMFPGDKVAVFNNKCGQALTVRLAHLHLHTGFMLPFAGAGVSHGY